MKLVKAHDLKQKQIIMVKNMVYIIFKVMLFPEIVEIETQNDGTGLLVFKSIEPILVLGELE